MFSIKYGRAELLPSQCLDQSEWGSYLIRWISVGYHPRKIPEKRFFANGRLNDGAVGKIQRKGYIILHAILHTNSSPYESPKLCNPLYIEYKESPME